MVLLLLSESLGLVEGAEVAPFELVVKANLAASLSPGRLAGLHFSNARIPRPQQLFFVIL